MAELKSIEEIIKEFPWNMNNDRVMVFPDPPETMLPSGLHIPDTAQEKPQLGTIIALGPETSTQAKTLEYMKLILEELDPTFSEDIEVYLKTNNKPGDRVLFGKYAGIEVVVDGVKYLVMRHSDIMATLKQQ